MFIRDRRYEKNFLPPEIGILHKSNTIRQEPCIKVFNIPLSGSPTASLHIISAREAETKANANQGAADALVEATKERDNAVEQLNSLDNMYCIINPGASVLSYLKTGQGENTLKTLLLKGERSDIFINKKEKRFFVCFLVS